MESIMKMYESPDMQVIALKHEGVVCGSDVETSGMGIPYINPFGDTTEQTL